MATWVDPVDSQTDPDAPLTSALAKRWDNNLIAMAEGAPGAPRVGWRAGAPYIDNITVNASSGQAGSGVITLPDRSMSFWLYTSGTVNTGGGTGSRSFRVRFSSDGGSTWSGYVTLLSLSSSTSSGGSGTRNMLIVKDRYIDNRGTGGSVSQMPVDGCNELEFSITTSGNTGSASMSAGIYLIAGSF